jgi:hypothetical protein
MRYLNFCFVYDHFSLGKSTEKFCIFVRYSKIYLIPLLLSISRNVLEGACYILSNSAYTHCTLKPIPLSLSIS